MTNNTIKSVLQEAQSKLIAISDSPALDAEILLSHCLKKDRTYLHTWPEHNVEQELLTCFQTLLKKRLTDYPIAYLTGTKAFWTLDLIVTPDVLIPRPETELLVETSLEKIIDIKSPKILDLGTGSGTIALALASERPSARIVACDYSSKALLIAKKNAEKHHLENNIIFIESDWFSNIPDNDYDLIVSNPPYIEPNDPHLKEEIRFEPQQALIAKDSGLKDITSIISHAQNYLKKHAWLIIEHGFEQAIPIQTLLEKYHYQNNKILVDHAGNDRLSIAHK